MEAAARLVGAFRNPVYFLFAAFVSCFSLLEPVLAKSDSRNPRCPKAIRVLSDESLSGSTNALVFENKFYVSNSLGNTISVVELDGRPTEVIADPAFDGSDGMTRVGGQLFVSNFHGNSIVAIDFVTGERNLILDPTFDAATEMQDVEGLLYVANWRPNSLSILDLETTERVGTIAHPSFNEPGGVGRRVGSNRGILVANFAGNTISVIDPKTRQLVDVISSPVLQTPSQTTSVNRSRYVSNFDTNSIAALDRRSHIRFPLEDDRFDGPGGVAFDKEKRLYVTSFHTTDIAILRVKRDGDRTEADR